jgi:hypothetical protein
MVMPGYTGNRKTQTFRKERERELKPKASGQDCQVSVNSKLRENGGRKATGSKARQVCEA